MPNILVTGCAGYIGSVLCDQLTKDIQNKVYGVDIFRYNNEKSILHLLDRPNFWVRKTNVQFLKHYRDLIKQADVIIPLAAYVGAPLCEEAKYSSYVINYETVAKIAEIASIHQHIIFPNTNSGYGTTDGTKEVTEQDSLNPISVYGKTKCLAEEAVLAHPNSTVFRLATVFGISPRMRFDLMVHDFFQKLFYHRALAIYEPDFMRNFVHIKDVTKAFIFAMKHNLQGVYNLGDPDYNMSKLTLAKKIADYLGLDETSIWIANGEDPDKRNYIVSNSKLMSKGFEFSQYLESALYGLQQLCSLLPESEINSMSNVHHHKKRL